MFELLFGSKEIHHGRRSSLRIERTAAVAFVPLLLFRRHEALGFQPAVSSVVSSSRHHGYDHGGSTSWCATSRDLEDVRFVAERAARAAGEIMLAATTPVLLATKANARDLVTESDLECQRVIEAEVSSAFPNDLFLGEEDVAPGSEASAGALSRMLAELGDNEHDDMMLWIVDPIDGTTNFQAGLPLYCVSIGVVSPSTGEVVVGVVHNPVLDETTSAVRGGGCRLNGDVLPLPTTSPSSLTLADSMVNVGFPVVKESTLRTCSRAVTALCTKVRGLRMLASAAQVMAWVAQGKIQAYVSWDLNAWDVAAGTLLIREAGGEVTDLTDGTEATVESRDLISTAPGGSRVKDELLTVLRENDCVRYDRQ